jgi:hypothetical protein
MTLWRTWISTSSDAPRSPHSRVGRVGALGALVVDVAVGYLVLVQVRAWYGADWTAAIPQAAASGVAAATGAGQSLVALLVDAPLGIKLNPSLTRELVAVTQYLLDVWAAFLWAWLAVYRDSAAWWSGAVATTIGRGLGVVLCGSVLQDLLVLMTVHVQCCFVYSRTLHRFNIVVLWSSFRLFRGKKANPLRNRIDSCEYEPFQLLFGTVILSASLFLYPTVLVLHCVFAVMWASAVAAISALGLVLGVYHAGCAGAVAVAYEVVSGRLPGPPVVTYTLARRTGVTAEQAVAAPSKPTVARPPRPLMSAWAAGWEAAQVASFVPDQSLVLPSS